MIDVTVKVYLYAWLYTDNDGGRSVEYTATSTSGMESRGYILLDTVDVELKSIKPLSESDAIK